MTLVQALLIGCVSGLSYIESNWLGECKLREPVVTGFLVGLILGDVQKGLLIGAELQMMWMGVVGVGPTSQLQIGAGGTIGAAIAITTGTGAEMAITFGIPVAIIMQFAETLCMTGFSGFMHAVERDIEKGNFKTIGFYHTISMVITFFIWTILTFIVLFYGNEAIAGIVENFPEWAFSALGAIAAILPALGFAMLLNLLMEVRLIPFFIIGFIIAAFTELSLLAIAALAVAVAWIYYLLKADTLSGVAAAGKKDEWED